MSDSSTTDGHRFDKAEDAELAGDLREQALAPVSGPQALTESADDAATLSPATPLDANPEAEAGLPPAVSTPTPYFAFAAEGSSLQAPFTPLPVRIPNLADALILLLMLLLGFLVTSGAAALALHYHWFGIHSLGQVQSDTRFALAAQALLYGAALAGAIPLFRMAWHKGLFDGLHWHWETAARFRYRLLGTAVVCNVIAMLGNAVLPFPQHAPIDKMFGTSTDAWLLMAFGITVAPFFEEMIFRGFLLPAIATAWDWCGERITRRLPRQLDAQGNPRWSVGAMIFSALIVSAPFALMHAEQVGNAWGPVLLLYCVSLILCTVRLATRSLAASTLVHSAYNFMLFTVMFIETDGFRHMDKM